MVRILVLPGRGNSGPAHWQSHWEQQYPEIQRVVQREWSNPNLEDWVAELDAAINAEQTPVVLIGHSLSVALVVHWASRHKGPVKGALLVAPSDVEHPSYPSGALGFSPLPQEALWFRSIVVASTDDIKVSLERAREFANAWGARLEIPGAFGHLGSQDNLGDWAYGKRLLESLLELD